VDLTILFILIALLFSAFFSGVEIAFVASNKLRIEIDKKQGNAGSSILSVLNSNPVYFIATMLVGNTLSLVIYGYLMAIHLEPFISTNITTSKVGTNTIQVIFSTLLILVTREFLPKAFFRINPNKTINFLGIPAFFIYFLLYPIAHFAMVLSSIFLRVFFRIKMHNKEKKVVFGAIDLDHIIEQSAHEVEIETEIEHDIKLFQNALDFSNVKLRECTIPRNEIEAVEINSLVEKLKEKFIETGYSKILIYKETIDHIIGYAQSSDLFQNPKDISSMLKNLIIAPETMAANKLLNLFMKEHKSIALIVDEFGGTAGIVTIEDIMEEIFGEIEDEHDSTDFKEEKLSNNEFIFSGRLEIDYLNEKFNLEIPESDDYETIAGYILHHHQQIPSENDKVVIANFEFEILKMVNPKIELIKMTIKHMN